MSIKKKVKIFKRSFQNSGLPTFLALASQFGLDCEKLRLRKPSHGLFSYTVSP